MKSEKSGILFSLFIFLFFTLHSSLFIIYSSFFNEGCPQAQRFCHSLVLSFLLVRSE